MKRHISSIVLCILALSAHGQMVFKSTPAPATQPAAPAQSSVPARKASPKPAAHPAAARQKVEASAPVAKPAPAAQPAPPAADKVLRAAAASLKKQAQGAKTNAELAKLVAASDIKIDLSVPGAAVIEPVTVYFVEPQGFFGSLFGSVKAAAKTNNDDPSTLRTKDGRKVLDSVKMAGQLRIPGATDDIISASMDYAQARGEIVDMEVWVDSEVEAMSLQNKFSATPIVRSIKVLSGKRNRFVFLLPAESNVREMKTLYVTPEPSAQGAPGAPAAAASSAASANAPELCPDASNFFTKGICEANLCHERPDLASHPTCVKVREMEAAHEQQKL